MGAVSGVYAAKVVVIAETMKAAPIALGTQAGVLRTRTSRDCGGWMPSTRGTCKPASNAEVERAMLDADMVIGAVLVPRGGADACLERVGLRMKPDRARRHCHRPGRCLEDFVRPRTTT